MIRHGSDDPVVIVGAGLAGLACATTLQRAGVPVTVLEAGDGIGGRVRSDQVDGFTLDRGFQVVLTAYPELHRQFDVGRLDLRAFEPGALVWRAGRGHVVADPFRSPRTVLDTALAPVGSPLDKLRIARLRQRVRTLHPSALLRGDDMPTAAALEAAGFSLTIVERFFTPLVGGIQLDPDLTASRRMFDVIFRMLADGDSAIPAAGMQALPAQLAETLPVGCIQLDSRVTGVDVGHDLVTLTTDDRQIRASDVVVATEGPAAARLLGTRPVASKSVSCVYFSADEAPITDRYVVLDGTGKGPVLNAAVMSNVSPTYAPPGKHLVVAALPGITSARAHTPVEPLAREQLSSWWGDQVDDWETIGVYEIEHGQPDQTPPFSPKRRVVWSPHLFVCGDHRDTASIQGALFSGRRCADALLSSRN